MASSGHAEDVVVEERSVASAGRQLAARLVRSSRPSGAGLLFLHGLESDQEGYQNRAKVTTAAIGATCLTFDLGGHGRSGGALGKLRPLDHLADAVNAYDELATGNGVDAERVGVCGASYGAFLACLLAAERRVHKLLLRAPALYDDNAVTRLLTTSPRSSGLAGPYRALDVVAGFAGRVLVVESERDETIPHSVIQAYLETRPDARHEILAGATHALTDPRWNEAFIEEIVGWFADL